MDAAADRVLDRQDAVAPRCRPGRSSNTSSKLRQGISCASASTRRAAASLKAPRLALIRDLHRRSTITYVGRPRSQIDNLYRIISSNG